MFSFLHDHLSLRLLIETALSEQERSRGFHQQDQVNKLEFALRAFKDDDSLNITLYKPVGVSQENNDWIVGVFNAELTTRCGEGKEIWLVKSVASEKGYGPLMYDIAMSMIYPGFLASDRSLVSLQARKIWNYMLYNRPNDYNIVPLDKLGCGFEDETDWGTENQVALNYGFSIKNKLNVQHLIKNHSRFMVEFSKKNINVGSLFDKATNAFFHSKYQNI